MFLILVDGAGGWSAGVEVGKVRKMKFRVDANEANKHMVVMSLAGMKADDYSPSRRTGRTFYLRMGNNCIRCATFMPTIRIVSVRCRTRSSL